MKNNVSWAKALAAGGWAIVFLLIAIIITAVAAVGIEGWDWNLLTEVFENLWEVFVAVLVFFTILVIFLYKYPIQTLACVLTAIAVLLVAASYRGSTTGESIRNYIDANYDFNYIATGAIVTAVLLVFIAIYRNQATGSKIEAGEVETHKEEAAGAEPVEDETPKAEAPKEEALEAEPVKKEVPKAEAPKEKAPEAEPVKEEAPKAEKPEEEVPEVKAPPDVVPEPETPRADTPTYKGLSKGYDDLNLMKE